MDANQPRIARLVLLLGALGLVGCGEEPRVPPMVPPQPQTTPASLPRIDLAGIDLIRAEAVAAEQVLVIDFWATWCVPCIETFPAIHDGLEAMGDRVRLMSVTIDGKGREQEAIAFLSEQRALKDAYFMPDPKEQERTVDGLGERWTNVVVPAILVFDPSGQLVGEWVGENFKGNVPEMIIALAHEVARSAPGS